VSSLAVHRRKPVRRLGKARQQAEAGFQRVDVNVFDAHFIIIQKIPDEYKKRKNRRTCLAALITI